MNLTPEEFVKSFVHGKAMTPKVRMEIAVKHAVGNKVTKENLPKAMKSLRSAISGKTECVSKTKCPRCHSFMKDVILDKGIQALYCSTDHVILPKM